MGLGCLLMRGRWQVILLGGVTGSGKTQTSLELAHLLDGEIVVGDSMQFYRGANIGTDKITPDQEIGRAHV